MRLETSTSWSRRPPRACPRPTWCRPPGAKRSSGWPPTAWFRAADRPVTLDVRSWRLHRPQMAGATLRGPSPREIRLEPLTETRTFPAGTVVVDVNQRAARVVAPPAGAHGPRRAGALGFLRRGLRARRIRRGLCHRGDDPAAARRPRSGRPNWKRRRRPIPSSRPTPGRSGCGSTRGRPGATGGPASIRWACWTTGRSWRRCRGVRRPARRSLEHEGPGVPGPSSSVAREGRPTQSWSAAGT